MIVGLGYKMQHGKDTVADVLVEEFGFTKYRFADKLKEAVCVIYGWSREDLEDPEFKQRVDPFWNATPREVLQRFGTEAVREVMGDQTWIRACMRSINANLYDGSPHYKTSHRAVICDVRFPNEATAVGSWPCWTTHLVNVHRPDLALTSNHAHPSETKLDNYEGWTHTILNDGSLEELQEKAREFGREITG